MWEKSNDIAYRTALGLNTLQPTMADWCRAWGRRTATPTRDGVGPTCDYGRAAAGGAAPLPFFFSFFPYDYEHHFLLHIFDFERYYPSTPNSGIQLSWHTGFWW